MINCPCCSDNMLRHIRGNQVYLFCPSCWQEMPNWIAQKDSSLPINQMVELVINQQQRTLANV